MKELAYVGTALIAVVVGGLWPKWIVFEIALFVALGIPAFIVSSVRSLRALPEREIKDIAELPLGASWGVTLVARVLARTDALNAKSRSPKP